MLFDVWLKGKSFPMLFYAGSVPLCASLIAIALLLGYDDSDPLYRVCKIVYRKVCHCRRPSTVRYVDLIYYVHQQYAENPAGQHSLGLLIY